MAWLWSLSYWLGHLLGFGSGLGSRIKNLLRKRAVVKLGRLVFLMLGEVLTVSYVFRLVHLAFNV